MSASKKKKDHMGEVTQGLTQKQLKEAKEASAAKRKTITYWVVGIVLVALVATLLVWDSGFFQKRAVAATVGSEQLTVGEMQYYYGMTRSNQVYQEQYMQQMYTQFGMEYTPTFDSSKSDAEQIKDEESGQTWAAYFRETALDTAKQVIALNAAAKEEGYTLSAEGKTTMQDNIKSMKDQVKTGGWASFGAYLGTAYGKYVSEGIYTSCQEKAALASEYQTHHQDSLTYTTSQLAAYEQENPALLQSYDFRYAYIPGDPEVKTGDDGENIAATDEEKAAATAAAKEKADALVNGVKAAAADKKEDSFNELVKTAVAEDSSYADPTNNLQSGVLGNDLSTNGAAYFEWLSDSARKAGDIEAISSGTGYYVVLFLKSELNDTPTVDVRHILIKAEAPVDDETTADVDESTGTPTQEALDKAKADAQAILDEFNALPDDKRTADAFGKLANEKSEDGGSNTKGGLYRYVEEGDMVPNFDAWIFDSSRKSGDTGLVANVDEGSSYYGYHVMYFVGQDGPKWHELAENSLRTDDMTKWMEDIQAPLTAEWTTGGDSIGK